jgi:hypothetical protein
VIYLHSWIQSIELVLFVWFVAWAGSHAVDFYRAGMERVRRQEARERASKLQARADKTNPYLLNKKEGKK